MAMRMQPEPGCGRAGVSLFTHKFAFLEDLRSHLGQRELLRRFLENGRETALRARHRRQVLTDANAQNVLHSLRGWNLKPVCIRGWRIICHLHHRNRLLKWNWPKVVEKRGDLL